MQKVLILGSSGMLGHKVFEFFSKQIGLDTYGTVTSKKSFYGLLPTRFDQKIVEDVYADKIATIRSVLQLVKPGFVINCIGVIKQNEESHNRLANIYLNAQFPHLLANAADSVNAKVITIATDCVFDGKKGSPYTELDLPTCHDIYGMTKYLGEINYGNHLTLRTSIIGHELTSQLSLLDWFLGTDEKQIKGFSKAIFSGFPTIELAHIISDIVLNHSDLKGLYHLSAEPISKYSLLQLVARKYGKNIDINDDSNVNIDRSLDSTRLRELLNYTPPSWENLVEIMHEDYLGSDFYIKKRKTYELKNHF